MAGSRFEMYDTEGSETVIHTIEYPREGWYTYFHPKDMIDPASSSPPPEFRYFRYYSANGCDITELELYGNIIYDSNLTDQPCDVEVISPTNESVKHATKKVTFQDADTLLVNKVSPNFGSILGGTELGIYFDEPISDGDLAALSVVIDQIPCVVNTDPASVQTVQQEDDNSKQDYVVKCTTGARPNYVSPTFEIKIDGKGKVASTGVVFYYAERWSDATTWGNTVPPREGESLTVAHGQTLVIDTSTPKLNLILVEGTVIVADGADKKDPNEDITIEAHQIYIRQGRFIAGTEEKPYQDKLTINLHGQRGDREIPIFGNKVLAVQTGTLDLHGVKRTPTWTLLQTTVNPGDDTITLVEDVDWQVGEKIVIASTEFNHYEAEEMEIAEVVSSNSVRLTTAFQYKHYAATQSYTHTKGDGSSETVEMEYRAEVGLLTRNIVFQGNYDEQSTKELHGAHIMLFSDGDEESMGRIEYIEVRNAGQSFKLGRYPIHFHMIGNVMNSYITGCAIHHTFQRAITVHAVKYLRIKDNVAYACRGHTYFIEDGVEEYNVLEHNLGISTRRINSLLNSDMTPATFWTSAPNNIWINNHAAGSDRYGFWFQLPPHPEGPSSTRTVCPDGTKLGEFRGNVSHSNIRYGLRIHPKWIPRERPCDKVMGSGDDLWTFNPPVPAEIKDYTSFKNGRNGAIGEDVGDIRFINNKVADVLLTGIEVVFREWSAPFTTTRVENALIVGRSENAVGDTHGSTGIRLPQREGFLVDGANFHNFPEDMYALGDESHSNDPIIRDIGVRMQHVQKLTFTNCAHKKISWFPPRNGTIKDIDGSLVGTAGAILVTYKKHLITPECTDERDTYDGMVCIGANIRRVLITSPSPSNRLSGGTLYIYRTTGEGIPGEIQQVDISEAQDGSTMVEKFVAEKSSIGWNQTCQRTNPRRSWPIMVVTGYEYKIIFGNNLDFDKFVLELDTFANVKLLDGASSPGYSDWVKLRIPYYDTREHFEIKRGGENLPLKETAVLDETAEPAGTHFFINEPAESEDKELGILASGITTSDAQKGWLDVIAHRCWDETGTGQVNACDDVGTTDNPVDEDGEELPQDADGEPIIAYKQSAWSNPNTWSAAVNPMEDPAIYLPAADVDVEIPYDMEVILDIDTPIFKSVTVYGKITFDPEKSVSLNSKLIFVRSGRIESGSAAYPTNPEITHKIVLHGDRTDETFAFRSEVEVFNNALAITGSVRMYGAPKTPWVRLVGDVYVGDTVIFVEQVDWKVGDSIVIGPSGYSEDEAEEFQIIGIENAKPGYVYVGPTEGSRREQEASPSSIDFKDDLSWKAKNDRSGKGLNTLSKFQVDVEPIWSTNLTKITLNNPTKFFHLGTRVRQDTTLIETRAEVGVLNRNVIIQGKDSGTWNCNIVVSDFTDYVEIGKPPVQRYGNVMLDNVEIKECGQAGVERAALRFDLSSSSQDGSRRSFLSNSVIRNSDNFGLNLNISRNIDITNNLIFRTQTGVVVSKCDNFKLEGNLVVESKKQQSDYGNFNRYSGYMICPHPEDFCRLFQVINNVASGYTLFGFASQGKAVTDTKGAFQGNIAHSGQYGIVMSNGLSLNQEGSHLTAYFNTEAGITIAGAMLTAKLSNIYSISNLIGFTAAYGTTEDQVLLEVNKAVIIGPTQYTKCTESVENCAKDPKCKGQIGIIAGITGSSEPSIQKMMMLPFFRPGGDAGYYMKPVYNNVTFRNFGKPDVCVGYLTHVGFNSNPENADLVFPQYFNNGKVVNVEDGYLFYLVDPDPAWANIEKCLDFPCTGLNQAVINDMDGGLIGGEGGVVLADYPTIVAQGCTKKASSNAYYCVNSDTKTFNYKVLYLESEDSDSNSKFIHPVYFESSDFKSITGEGYYNKLNAYMDHGWVTAYPSMLHTARFPAALEIGKTYTVTFTGTRPKNIKLDFMSDVDENDAVILIINYQSPETPTVIVDGNQITPLPYNGGDNYPNLTQAAGTNFWDHKKYQLYVLVKGNKVIQLKIVDQIKLTYRLQMSIDDFFNDTETLFRDRIAAALGIPPYRMRCIDVQSGSVIFNVVVFANIESNATSNTSQAAYELESLMKTAQQLVETNGYNFDVPLISMSSEYVGVTEAGTGVASQESSKPTQTSNPGYDPEAENDGQGNDVTGGLPGSNGELIGEGNDYTLFFSNWLLAVIVGVLVIVIIASGIISQLGKSDSILEEHSPDYRNTSFTKDVIINPKLQDAQIIEGNESENIRLQGANSAPMFVRVHHAAPDEDENASNIAIRL